MGFLGQTDAEANAYFQGIDSRQKIADYARRGILMPLYLMTPRFGGEETMENAVFVPPEAVWIKERYDDVLENLLQEGKINNYSCEQEYKGDSFVPSKILVQAFKDGVQVFCQTINVW